MIQTRFYIPVRDNDGAAFTPTEWAALERFLYESFDGFTHERTVRGASRSVSGRRVDDISRVYVVLLGSLAQLPEFVRALEQIRMDFRQETIYVEIERIAEIFGP